MEVWLKEMLIFAIILDGLFCELGDEINAFINKKWTCH